MPEPTFSTIRNGSYSQSGVSDALRTFLDQTISQLNTLRNSIYNSAYRSSYDRLLEPISGRIGALIRKYAATDSQWNVNNSTTYYDVFGQPYMKNGEVLVIIGDRFPTAFGSKSTVVNGITQKYNEIGYAAYDAVYNRIIIRPWFANAVMAGRVYYSDSRGNYHRYTMDQIIHHEFGHAGDVTGPGGGMSATTLLNNRYDNNGELVEQTGQLVTGAPVRTPHGPLRFKDDNGNWVDDANPFAVVAFQRRFGAPNAAPHLGIIRDLQGQYHTINTATGETSPVSVVGGVLGRMAGSTLGNYLAREDGTLAQIAASTVLGSIGQIFGDSLALYGHTQDLSVSFEAAFRDFDQTLFNNLKSASIGALTAFTSMELGRALGIEGFGAELFNVAAGSAVGPIYDKVLNNVLAGQAPFKDFSTASIFGKGATVGSVAGPAIASFLGAKLGSLVISPTTSAGAALASIGSAVGAYALGAAGSQAIGGLAAAIFQSLGSFIAPGVGAFIGFVLGALVGKLFGKKKPRVPSASADIALDLENTQFKLGSVTIQNNGSRDLVTSMATSAVHMLNGLIDTMVGGSEIKANGNSASVAQAYGHLGNQIRAKFAGGAWQNFDSADKAVEWGVLSALDQTKIKGGDLLIKRAIATSPAVDIVSLLGDIQIATDYHLYLLNREVINAMIAADPLSSFTAAWVTTLGRVSELGLNRAQPSDLYGGLQGFAESFGFGADGLPYEAIKISFEGADLRIATTDGSGPFELLAAHNNVTGADAAKSVFIPNFGSNVGYTPWAGQATAGNDIWVASGSAAGVTMDDQATTWEHVWDPAENAWVYREVTVTGGDDIFVGSNHNDHLYGRDGNDWLDGGAGHDWIEGGAGDDVLLGDAGVDKLIGGDGADYLAGGEGHDYVQSWIGGPAPGGLYGGAGNDTLVGGRGIDALFGESGNDTFIVDEDGGVEWDYFDGGAGSDTVSFERFASGVSVDMRTGAGDGYTTRTYGDGWVSIENLTGSRHRDHLVGDWQNNVLRGLDGNDTIHGLDGNDVIEGGAGADTMYGGAGIDTLSYENSLAAVSVDLGTGAALGGDASGDVFAEFENLRGSRFNDALTGDAGNNVLEGLRGDDDEVLEGGAGTDAAHLGEAATALNDDDLEEPDWRMAA